MKKTIITKKTLKASTLTVAIALLAISALLLTGCGSSDAESVALDHAGVSAAEADALRSTRRIEDGEELYDVKFKTESYSYNYTVNAESGEVIRSQKTLITNTTSSAAQGEYITEERAIDIALADAGLAKDSVLLEKSEFDRDDGRQLYEVDFYADGWEYDYDIDALSGEIVKIDKEKDKVKVKDTTSTSDKSKNENTTDSTAYIGSDTAKAIALEHAGVSADVAVFERTELDRDDGRYLYEVDFYASGTEYEYDIDALSGEIIKVDTEKEKKPSTNRTEKPEADKTDSSDSTEGTPTVVPPTVTPPTTATEYIGSDAAKAIALEHAGLTADVAVFERTELDRDDGRYLYEVDFYASGTEYEYDIDALSGEIIKVDTEKEKKPSTNQTAKPEADKTDSSESTEDTPTATPPTVTPPTTATEYIGSDAAKAIALEHAGLTADAVRFDGVELDREKGRYVYEVDFEQGNLEFEYEIDALTGEIIKWEKDIDD